MIHSKKDGTRVAEIGLAPAGIENKGVQGGVLDVHALGEPVDGGFGGAVGAVRDGELVLGGGLVGVLGGLGGEVRWEKGRWK